MNKEGIILAGGRGLRLKGDVNVPKPLVKINDTDTLLEYQIK